MLSESEIAEMQQVCESVCRTEARRWPSGNQLVEDCIQTILLKVWTRITSQGLPGPAVAAYTRTTAFFEARHFFRRHCLSRVSLDACEEPHDARELNPAVQLEQTEAAMRVQAALLRLPPEQREALEVVSEARKHNQAAQTLADRLGCKRQKIYYWRSQGINTIRQMIGSDYD